MRREDYLTAEFVEKMRFSYYRERKIMDIEPKHLALLGIDLQRYFLEPGRKAYLPSSPELINRLRNFYTYAKEMGIRIILTRHCHEGGKMARWWGAEMRCASADTEIHPLLQSFADYIVEKRTYDAFYRTTLEELLKNLEIETLIITGVMTHLCCETTARNAFVRGYNIIFPIDGTLTQNAELHEGTIRAIAHGFAPTPTLEDVIQWTRRWE
ncbi:MAG: cysteine hydrolase [Euryarchaeota archaeon]|nr:cysteine hydrolase [Euryarchaeota archaeon]